MITKTDIPGVYPLIRWVSFAWLLSVFPITDVANSVNFINGFNRLASMCVPTTMLALAYVAFRVNDTFASTAALITAGGVLGFFVWNLSDEHLRAFLSSADFVNRRVWGKDTAPSAG